MLLMPHRFFSLSFHFLLITFTRFSRLVGYIVTRHVFRPSFLIDVVDYAFVLLDVRLMMHKSVDSQQSPCEHRAFFTSRAFTHFNFATL